LEKKLKKKDLIFSFEQTTGLSNTLTEIYITTQPIENFANIIFLFIVSQVRLVENERKEEKEKF